MVWAAWGIWASSLFLSSFPIFSDERGQTFGLTSFFTFCSECLVFTSPFRHIYAPSSCDIFLPSAQCIEISRVYHRDLPSFSVHARVGNVRKMGESARILEALDRSQAIAHYTPSGFIVHANSNFLQIMGYELDDILGQSHQLFVDPSFASSAEYQDFWHRLEKVSIFRFCKRIGIMAEIWIRAAITLSLMGVETYQRL